MERWVGRVALVTGASSGIGRALAETLARHGMRVIGCSRNIKAIQQVDSIAGGKGSLTAMQCDVSQEGEVRAMFEQIRDKFGGVDVCINNAGLSHYAPLLTGETDQWRHMFEVNVLGMCMCTKEAVKSMKDRKVDDGHIIQINSGVGHKQYTNNPGGHFYSATKFAVTALADGLRNELRGTHIRVTSVSPGLVETDFSYRMYSHDQEKAKQKYSQFENLKPDDIVDAIVYALSAPRHVQVHEVMVNPTEAP